MLEFYSSSRLNIIQLLVLITFINALLFLGIKNKIHKFLVAILASNFLNELFTIVCILNKIDYSFLYSITIIIHNVLWLILLYKLTGYKTILKYILIVYLCCALINLIVFEGFGHFNNYTFVFGAFIYISIFIISSFKELKKENFPFFYSNNYLLLFAPVLFFLGLSFYFGFQNSALGDIIIIGDLNLYDALIYFVNIIYYTLINIYIYREKRLKNAG